MPAHLCGWQVGETGCNHLLQGLGEQVTCSYKRSWFAVARWCQLGLPLNAVLSKFCFTAGASALQVPLLFGPSL